jgi:four helix bundle protein
MGVRFSFEELEVWQKAVDFSGKIIKACENLSTDKKHFRLIEQIEASVVSIATNIAEGKGRFSKKEFIQFLHIAKGSLFETVAFLAIFKNNLWINDKLYNDFMTDVREIGKMLSSFINSIGNSI